MTRATVVGAGGLGGPIALSLGAAGIELTIVDPDVIEVSNLHRQIAFAQSDMGKPKATLLADAVAERGGAPSAAIKRAGRSGRRRHLGRATISSSTAATIRRRSSPSPIGLSRPAGCMSSRRRCALVAMRSSARRAARATAACSRSRSMPPRARRPACSVPWSVRSAVSPARSRSASRAVIARTPARSSYSMICARREPRIVRFAARPGCTSCARARTRLTANVLVAK